MIQDNQNINKEEVSIRELFFLIKSRAHIILISLLLSLTFAFCYLFITKPIYTATGSIIVDAENSRIGSIFDMGLGENKNELENEIEVLKSRTISEQAIRKLLNSEHRNDLLLFKIKKQDLDLDEPNISDSLFKTFVRKLNKEIKISNLRKTDVLKISYKSNDSNEAALIVNTIIDVYQEKDQEYASGEMSHLKDFLLQQLKLKESELNEIEQELKLFQEREHIYGLDDNSSLLLNQLTSIEADYYNSEAKKNILSERKKYFENQLSKDEKEFTNRVSNTLDVQLYSIRQELSSLEAEYISTKSKQGQSHPAVVELRRKIKNLKNILNDETKKFVNQGISVANPIEYRQAIMDSVINLDVLISGYDSKLLELKNLVLRYENNLSSLPEKYLLFSRLQRDKVILDETYSLMKQKLEEAKITEASQLGKIRIVDPAQPSSLPSFPNKRNIIFIAIIAGLILGAVVILSMQILDSTIKSIEEIERRGLSILAIIPSIGATEKSKRKKKKGYKLNLKPSNGEKIERRLLTHEDPKSPISEAYRSLRTSLMYDSDDTKGKVMLVSSPGPGEGKTTTVANLAITYANMGRKTLLIDSDLRKPVIHKMFKNEKGKNLGFTSFLSGQELNVDNLIYSSNLENLSLLSSGIIPPNPSELLSSEKMDEFLAIIKEKFDIILFDTPPLIAVTDALVVSKYADKFLLVIRASVTQKGALERSLVNMHNIDKNIHGVIFNGVNESNTYGGGYYYNYYQEYYGK